MSLSIAPTAEQNDEFDALVEKIGEDAAKHVLNLTREAGYDDLVYAFDALTPAEADVALRKLREYHR